MENKKFKIWWDGKEGIIRAKFWGEQEEENAQSALEALQKMVAEKPDKPLLLIDLSEAGSASAKARKKFVEIAKIANIKKEALFGSSTVARVVTSFVLKFAGASNAKLFVTEEEAFKWLKEE